jgi:hypothetical protein
MTKRCIPYIILLVLALSSCNTLSICDDDSQSYLTCRFRTLENGEIKDTTLEAISIYGIRGSSRFGLLYDSAAINKILLPLDPLQGNTEYVFFTPEKMDTLRIDHESEAYLISYDCGFAARFILENFRWGDDLIKDVEVQLENVDAENLPADEAHIWIYF